MNSDGQVVTDNGNAIVATESSAGAVRYDESQTLSDTQKERARGNINASSSKYGVISQTQTWASDYSGYTMSNQVYGLIPQANIDLFVSAGAEFNDTDAPIVKTAPWGEQVQHLPGYFYLNGIGDLSYNDMLTIYSNRRWSNNRSEFIMCQARTLFAPYKNFL